MGSFLVVAIAVRVCVWSEHWDTGLRLGGFLVGILVLEK